MPSKATTLAEFMRESETDRFLLIGPPAPRPGWVYRDFYRMPRHLWLTLLAVLGEENMQVVSTDPSQPPLNEVCRAQVWISPQAQQLWASYLKAHQ